MPAYTNIDGVLRPVKSIYDNIDGVFHEVTEGYDNIDGVLRKYHGESNVSYIAIVLRWMAYYPGSWEDIIVGPVGSQLSQHPIIIEKLAEISEYYGVVAYIPEEEDVQFPDENTEDLPWSVEIFLSWESGF